jgi:hypothetical protein
MKNTPETWKFYGLNLLAKVLTEKRFLAGNNGFILYFSETKSKTMAFSHFTER